MGKVNWQRVILGGLLAGVIIDASEWVTNGVVFASDWANVMKNLNSSSNFSVQQIAALNVWGFLTGIAMIWLYAAIRPRFGEGPKTAVLAGAAMWFMNYGLGGSFPVVTHLFPLGLAAVTTLMGLVEVVVAGLAGAWVYREASQPEVRQFSQAARR
jgi:predicted permease